MDQVNPAAPIASAPQPDTSLHFLDYWRIIRIRKTVILAVFLLVVITATLVTFVLPKKYASRVRLKIEGDISDVGEMGNESLRGRSYDIYFLETEFAIMQSELILVPVIEQLELNKRWASKIGTGSLLKTEETLLRLKNKLSVRPARNTSLIEIHVLSEDPVEARDIAEAIAAVYAKYRMDVLSKRSQGGSVILEGQIAEQDKLVKAAEDKVSLLRDLLKISEMDLINPGSGSIIEGQIYRQIEFQRLELEPIFQKEFTLYQMLTNMPPQQLRYSILTAVQPDAFLSGAIAELSLNQNRYITLTNDLGTNHSDVVGLRASIADLDQKVQLGVQGIMDALRIRVESAAAQLAKIKAEGVAAQERDIEKAAKAQEYFREKRNLEGLQKFRDLVAIRLAQIKVDAALPKTIMVTITDHAQVNQRAVQPNKPLAILVGVVIGLVVGVGLAFFIEYLDTSVKTIDEVERSLQAPVLGVIPQNVGYLLKEGTESPHAEAYRVLRTNLLFSRKDEKLSSIVVVSAGAGEGKSTTVFNLATIFAMHGNRVILVDSDLRRPTIHKILGVSNALGLTNYLLKQNTLEEVIQTSSLPTLDVLPSGKLPSSSMGILNSKAMRDLISELKQRYDFVFFDSPPMVGLSDASILCSEMDLTVQVIQYRRYPQPMTIRAKQMIEKVGGRLVGIVLNNINMSQDEYYYYYSGYYGGYYGDYYSKQDEDKGAENGEPGKKGKVEIKQKY